MVKIGLRIFSATIFITYVFVPIITNYMDIQEIIYYDVIPNDLIFSNFICALIPLMLSFLIRDSRRTLNIRIRPEYLLNIILISLLIVTVLIDFRTTKNLIISKSIELLFPLLVLSACIYSISNKKRKIILVILLSVVLFITDSRGLLLFSAGSILMTPYLSKPLIFKTKHFLILPVSIVLFTIWGISREEEGVNFLFSFVYRISEPYWYFASENSFSLSFNDIFKRIIWSITRINIFGIEGSIDGNHYYVDYILGIKRNEDVSLPITLIGNGFLWLGKLGSQIFVTATSFFIILIYKLLDKLGNIGAIYSSYLTLKLINLHAKSLSGTFSYLFYESIRDLIFVFIVFGISHIIFKNLYVHRRMVK